MKVKSIEIKNVKGISNRIFDLDLIPNKPNLLVAPNGFGKSSFSIAFDSLKPNKIELNDKNYHDGNVLNRPALKLIVEESGCQRVLFADDTTNNILDEFDVFVINSQLAAKATLLKISGKSIAKPAMEIVTITLINSVPEKIAFIYSPAGQKKSFGVNGKILPDISYLLKNGFCVHQIELSIDFKKFDQVRISKSLETFKSDINGKQGTVVQIKQWILDEKIDTLRSIEELKKLALLFSEYSISSISDETDSYLAALQIIDIYKAMGSSFKKACKYQYYLWEKEEYKDIIKSFNSTRLDIKPKEDKKKGLIVEWPKAHEISNGQRDILSFIVLLLKARRSFDKRNCILIIDEIFDYLDDANLISFQYFITNFIEKMKESGRYFFPLLMTHLDPVFFNHFCFNKHKIKVHYLKKISTTSSPHLLKLIRKREESSIKVDVDQYYFHYNPNNISLASQFSTLDLNSGWNESGKFHAFIQSEVAKYLNDKNDYDPLAICFGVRVKIEHLLYDKISDPAKQQIFIDSHGTKNKLEFCEQIAIDVPEKYYLLGIIYNDKLHWHNGIDIITPLAIKLENLTIKNLIKDIFM